MRCFIPSTVVGVSCLVLWAAPVLADQPLMPVRVANPPLIDGMLDDVAWQTASAVDSFTTFSPDFGRQPSQKTQTLMAYDSENLYFAFRCYDTDPDRIKAAVTSRDNIRADDWVCINLDSFNDQQSLYALYVNPVGIQMDSRFAANLEDFSVDLVWFSAGQITRDGYTVEVGLPLKSFRYTAGDSTMMSVFFERRVSRTSEHDSYPAMDPAKGYAFLTQMKPMVYHGLKNYAVIEILPAVTFSQKYIAEGGNLIVNERTRDLSLTAKFGITSDLTLDGTYNPDFSQIEADAGQIDVNIRYALYYPEKRPFFLEGSEIYNLAATQISEIDPLRSVVHTRTIVDPIAGMKITGKIGSKSTVATMYAVDELLAGETSLSGEYASFPVARFKQSLNNDSYIGGIFAARELKTYSNRLGGIDAMHRVTDASMLDYHLLYSSTRMTGVTERQAGHAIGTRYGYSTRALDYTLGFKDLSEDFNASTGYVTRTGVSQIIVMVRPKFYPDVPNVQRIDGELFSGQTLDKPSGLWETFNHVSVQCLFLGALTAKAKYSYSTEIFEGERFKTGGIHLLLEGQWTKQFYLGVLYRRVNAIYYSVDPFQGKSNKVTVELIYQPSSQIESDLSFLFSDFSRSSDGQFMYEYPIVRERLTFQLNKYLFFRGIVEYNRYRDELLTDFLASFTYVPGTVIHLGYGSLYQKSEWRIDRYVHSDEFHEMKRGFFFKMSYLWRV